MNPHSNRKDLQSEEKIANRFQYFGLNNRGRVLMDLRVALGGPAWWDQYTETMLAWLGERLGRDLTDASYSVLREVLSTLPKDLKYEQTQDG